VAEKIFLKTIQLITHQEASSVFNKILIYLKMNNINSLNGNNKWILKFVKLYLIKYEVGTKNIIYRKINDVHSSVKCLIFLQGQDLIIRSSS
jgi:hypothetical protein